jgi:hypothetical protein
MMVDERQDYPWRSVVSGHQKLFPLIHLTNDSEPLGNFDLLVLNFETLFFEL